VKALLHLGLALAAGCSARPSGSFPHVTPPARGEDRPAPAAATGDGGIAGHCRSPFFRGLEHLAPALGQLAPTAPPPGAPPLLLGLEGPDASVLRALRAAGRPRPSILVATGFAARVGRPPAEVADVLMDPATARRTLDADDARTLSDTGDGTRRTRTISLALLNKGKGPFRFDFRWAFRVVREDLPGGTVLFRYDLLPAPAPERVSVFQGAAILEPDAGGGTRVVEALVLGTDVSLPFFLKGEARAGVMKMLGIRATRVAQMLR
jgi:hypothetical protein